MTLRRMPDGRLILDERCTCGHLRSEHALPGCGVRATTSNHLECPCLRYTWKTFVFASDAARRIE